MFLCWLGKKRKSEFGPKAQALPYLQLSPAVPGMGTIMLISNFKYEPLCEIDPSGVSFLWICGEPTGLWFNIYLIKNNLKYKSSFYMLCFILFFVYNSVSNQFLTELFLVFL